MGCSLSNLIVGTDYVFSGTKGFSGYRLLIEPALQSADDVLFQRISLHLKNVGHFAMTLMSGFANKDSVAKAPRNSSETRADRAALLDMNFRSLAGLLTGAKHTQRIRAPHGASGRSDHDDATFSTL